MVTRRDLSPGNQATQAAHAAFYFSYEHRSILQEWHENSQYLVLLAVESEQALKDLVVNAEKVGLPFSKYHEPDFNDELTAVALAPSAAARKLCANFPLALKQEATV